LTVSTTYPKRLGVVVNPTSGKGRGARAGEVVIDRLVAAGHDVWNLSGSTADLALEHARRAAAVGIDALVVVGGDGMVHLGSQVVAGTGMPLGIVAVGTGNDFATTLGVPIADPAAATDVLVRGLDAGTTWAVDALRVTGSGLAPRGLAQGETPVRWVAGAVCAGIDAAVNERANAMLHPKGSSRYVVAALREIAGYHPWSYRLTFDGVADEQSSSSAFPGLVNAGPGRMQWESAGALVTAANGSQFGGGIPVAPGAKVDDGIMNVVLARDVGRVGASILFVRMLMARHLSSPKVRMVNAHAVTIEAVAGAARIPSTFGDGEHLGTLPVRVELVPQALTVVVARS
jgi:diacylglycerol kinase (ATP)